MPTLYVPHISRPSLGDRPPAPLACQMSMFEYELYRLIAGHPAQQRDRLICDDRLCRAARAKAARLSELVTLDHVVDGRGPNRMVEEFGYSLPDYYSDDPTANQIESLACGQPSPITALAAFLKSPPHRRHLLGDHAGYRAQEAAGIGYHNAPANPGGYNDHWCILTCPPDGRPRAVAVMIPIQLDHLAVIGDHPIGDLADPPAAPDPNS